MKQQILERQLEFPFREEERREVWKDEIKAGLKVYGGFLTGISAGTALLYYTGIFKILFNKN
jgi:hypothetical protein